MAPTSIELWSVELVDSALERGMAETKRPKRVRQGTRKQ